MTDCKLCGDDINQGEILQAILDNKPEEGHVDWVQARREIAEVVPYEEHTTLTMLKKHVDNHIQVVDSGGQHD